MDIFKFCSTLLLPLVGMKVGLPPAWVLAGAVHLPVPVLPSALPPKGCTRSANGEGLGRPFHAVLGTLTLGCLCYRDKVLVEEVAIASWVE